jgi:hypothetical protein
VGKDLKVKMLNATMVVSALLFHLDLFEQQNDACHPGLRAARGECSASNGRAPLIGMAMAPDPHDHSSADIPMPRLSDERSRIIVYH